MQQKLSGYHVQKPQKSQCPSMPIMPMPISRFFGWEMGNGVGPPPKIEFVKSGKPKTWSSVEVLIYKLCQETKELELGRGSD